MSNIKRTVQLKDFPIKIDEHIFAHKEIKGYRLQYYPKFNSKQAILFEETSTYHRRLWCEVVNVA